MRGTPLLEVEISVKRDDCKVSNVMSRFRLKGNLVNLNIGVEESSHLLEMRQNYKNIIAELKQGGVKASAIKRDKIIALSTSCISCRVLARLNSVVLSARSPQKGVVIFRLLMDRKSLKRVIEEFENEGIEYAILEEIPYVTLSGLTSRQSEIVLFALVNGYFDVKRRINLSSIAKNFSISPATADLILRRALKKIVDAHVMRKV